MEPYQRELFALGVQRLEDKAMGHKNLEGERACEGVSWPSIPCLSDIMASI